MTLTAADIIDRLITAETDRALCAADRQALRDERMKLQSTLHASPYSFVLEGTAPDDATAAKAAAVRAQMDEALRVAREYGVL